MNANWILSIYRIVIPLVAVMAFVNCSGSNGHDEKHQIVDLNNRYRSLIQEQFQTKSRHFNADTRSRMRLLRNSGVRMDSEAAVLLINQSSVMQWEVTVLRLDGFLLINLLA